MILGEGKAVKKVKEEEDSDSPTPPCLSKHELLCFSLSLSFCLSSLGRSKTHFPTLIWAQVLLALLYHSLSSRSLMAAAAVAVAAVVAAAALSNSVTYALRRRRWRRRRHLEWPPPLPPLRDQPNLCLLHPPSRRLVPLVVVVVAAAAALVLRPAEQIAPICRRLNNVDSTSEYLGDARYVGIILAKKQKRKLSVYKKNIPIIIKSVNLVTVLSLIHCILRIKRRWSSVGGHDDEEALARFLNVE